MKSRRMPLALTLSLVVHLCLAVAVAYVAISVKYELPRDTIDVSFFTVTPPRAKLRELKTPDAFVAPTPVVNWQVAREAEPTARRSVTTARQTAASLNPVLPANPVMADRPAAPKREQVNIAGAPSVRSENAQPLSTAAELEIASEGVPPAGLGSSTAVTAGLNAGSDGEFGTGTSRGAFGNPGGGSQGRMKSHSGLASLVGGKTGVANMDAALEDVTENIVLGNSVPPLPKGTPGAIIQGRGKEILGRLNLVRLDDPLHPNYDF